MFNVAIKKTLFIYKQINFNMAEKRHALSKQEYNNTDAWKKFFELRNNFKGIQQNYTHSATRGQYNSKMFTILENTAAFFLINSMQILIFRHKLRVMSKEWIQTHFKVSQIITADGQKLQRA